MAVEGFMIFAGTEIGNTNRVGAYLAAGGPAAVRKECGCPSIPAAIDDAPYVSPAADPAPWYDADEPESGRFGGLWIETVAGFKTSPYQRKVTQRTSNGAVRSRARMNSKTLTVTGWLFAADCCAADYGLRWLTAALNASCTVCSGNDLCFLSCCPTRQATGVGDQGPDGVWYDTTKRMRTMTGAALISGPTVIDQSESCDGACGDGTRGLRPIYRVQFIIDVDPCVWRQPDPVLAGGTWPVPTGNEPCNITWSSNCCDLLNPGCRCSTPCPPDVQCAAPPIPPRPPISIPDCICLPLQAVRQCVDVPPTKVPDWEQGSLTLRIAAGSKDMRNLTVTVWPNTIDRDPALLDDCDACGRYYITHIPANSTLTIDGRRCTATLDCPGNVTADAAGRVYGSAGGPLQCVTLSCGIQYTVCADVDIRYVAPNATLSVDVLRCEATS